MIAKFRWHCLSFFSIVRNVNHVKKFFALPRYQGWGGLAQLLASWTTDQGVAGSRPGRGTVCCGLEQVIFTHCLVLVKPRKPWTDDSE